MMTDPEFLTATRSSYDTIAAHYAQWIQGELQRRPVDRAMLAAFAEAVNASGNATVADIGCGQGRVTAHLRDLGVDAFGIDLSPGMIEQARAAYPELRFEIGSMLDLALDDASLGGVVAWYSIIHVPDEVLPQAFAEFRRVLIPGGQLLLAFQLGHEVSHRGDVDGHEVSLDFRRRQLDDVAQLLELAGFAVTAKLHREPMDDPTFPEKTPQGFMLVECN